MGRFLFLLFVVLPVLDVWLIFRIGGLLGFWSTVGLVLLTGFVGAWMARREGGRVLGDWQAALAGGQAPSEGVLGGVLVFVGGLFLVTPGVITDVFGFLLLVPPVRRWLATKLKAWAERRVAEGSMQVSVGGMGGGMMWQSSWKSSADAHVIDVDGDDLPVRALAAPAPTDPKSDE